MQVRLRLALIAAAAAALALTGTAVSARKVSKLTGIVGPGFTISLKNGKGKALKTTRAGRYTITVSDKSSIHNFRLKGPGLNREITSTPFVGTRSITVTLKKGIYRFDCDPHATVMKGSFRVT